MRRALGGRALLREWRRCLQTSEVFGQDEGVVARAGAGARLSRREGRVMDDLERMPEGALAWHRAGRGAVLATVVETWGSALGLGRVRRGRGRGRGDGDGRRDARPDVGVWRVR